jgi:UDP-glucose 4-epimerase
VKILVTGGAGYIGGTVAGLLSEKGHKAVVFDNLSHSRRDLLPAGVDLIEGELADRQSLEQFLMRPAKNEPFDAVLHFAALIEAGESMVRPGNLLPQQHRFHAFAARGDARLRSATPGFLFHRRRLRRAGIRSDSGRCAPLPTNPYGQSKLLVEQMLAWLNRIHGLRYASLRYFNVAGAPRVPRA